jgi:hypothetical protein
MRVQIEPHGSNYLIVSVAPIDWSTRISRSPSPPQIQTGETQHIRLRNSKSAANLTVNFAATRSREGLAGEDGEIGDEGVRFRT